MAGAVEPLGEEAQGEPQWGVAQQQALLLAFLDLLHAGNVVLHMQWVAGLGIHTLMSLNMVGWWKATALAMLTSGLLCCCCYGPLWGPIVVLQQLKELFLQLAASPSPHALWLASSHSPVCIISLHTTTTAGVSVILSVLPGNQPF